MCYKGRHILEASAGRAPNPRDRRKLATRQGMELRPSSPHEPAGSDLARSGATALLASGKFGLPDAIGPTSTI